MVALGTIVTPTLPALICKILKPLICTKTLPLKPISLTTHTLGLNKTDLVQILISFSSSTMIHISIISTSHNSVHDPNDENNDKTEDTSGLLGIRRVRLVIEFSSLAHAGLCLTTSKSPL